MKKLLCVVLSILLIIPCAISLVACGGKTAADFDSPEELSTLYKDLAENLLEKLGYQIKDQTAEASAFSASVPNKKQEATDPEVVTEIRMNSKGAAGIIYMISLLYANENYLPTDDGVATFDVNVSMQDFTFLQTYTFKPTLDIENEKIYLEWLMRREIMPGMDQLQYGFAEFDVDFDDAEVKAFSYYSAVYPLDLYVDMAMTEDGKSLIYQTEDPTDDFVVAVTAKKDAFLQEVSTVQKLEYDFSEEVQTYFTMLEELIDTYL